MEEKKQRNKFYSAWAKGIVIALFLTAVACFSVFAMIFGGLMCQGFSWEELTSNYYNEKNYLETQDCGQRMASQVNKVRNALSDGKPFLTKGKLDKTKLVDITRLDAKTSQQNPATTYTVEDLLELKDNGLWDEFQDAIWSADYGIYEEYDEDDEEYYEDGEYDEDDNENDTSPTEDVDISDYTPRFRYLYNYARDFETVLPESGETLAEYARTNPKKVSLFELYQQLSNAIDQLSSYQSAIKMDDKTNVIFMVQNLDNKAVYTNVSEWADGNVDPKSLEDLMEDVAKEVTLEEFVPRYTNQAIIFTGDDMGGDRSMMIVLLYILIAIMAFVFAVTTNNTIVKEAAVIGTLRASGYTKNELIRHYMTMPLAVTLVGALIGNILGYTVCKDICAGMYYGSYSLPTYHTIWSAEAFWKTTLVPVALMAVVNAGILYKKLSLSPLQFLRRDLKKKRKKRTFHLSSRIPFFTRFRLRVIFQNVSNYVVLLAGILFANLLLMFGLALPAVLDHYQSVLKDNLLSNYQYILQIPAETMDEDKKLESLVQMMYVQSQLETDNDDAEKFSAYSLNTLGDQYKSEEVLLYGIQPDSRYIQIPEEEISNGNAYISSAYADKYQLKKGDTITLKEKYEDDQYTFTVSGIYDYEGGISVYLSQDSLNKTFDLDKSYFSGYFSETPITDIDEKYISTVIDLESLTKISRQLDVSMGSMMGLVDGFAVLMFMILIYLLSKIIIEKNAQSISMVKILGYSNREVSRLYIVSTSIMVVLFLLLSLPVEYWAMEYLFRAVMLESISGWITFYIESAVYVKMFLLGIGTYAVVAALEYRRICRVPMDEALKNVE